MNQRSEDLMIARTWHGRLPAAKADTYDDYLLEREPSGLHYMET